MKLTTFDVLAILLAAAVFVCGIIAAYLFLFLAERVLGEHFNKVAALMLFLLLWDLKIDIRSLESRVSSLEKRK